MYSQQEASQLRQEFWTAFGQYMTPVLSAEGTKTNWVNYKTGEKHLYFRMHAGRKDATISIELTHPDADVQQMYFEQFEQLREILHAALGEEWNWAMHVTDEYGKLVSKIYADIEGVSVFRKEDWPALISFFKPRIIALDEFWSSARYTFETLR
jgi:hypothetical protein